MTKPSYLITTQSYRHEYGHEHATQYGYLIDTNFDDKQRLLAIDAPTESPHDERIKGGLRGVHIWNDKVYVATWNCIYIVDYDSMTVEDKFSHPLMSDVHGIYVDDSGYWVTSSLIDSLIHYSHDGHVQNILTFSSTELYPRKERRFLDMTQDYRLRGKGFSGFRAYHANHVTAVNDEFMLVTGRGVGSSNGRITLLHRDTFQYRIFASNLKGPHDGLFIDDNLFAVTETNSATVAVLEVRTDDWKDYFLRASSRLYRMQKGTKVAKRLKLPTDKSKFWTRGLARTSDNTFLIGKSVFKSDTLNKASVIRIADDNSIRDEYFLDIDDYPECRIFQILEVPQG